MATGYVFRRGGCSQVRGCFLSWVGLGVIGLSWSCSALHCAPASRTPSQLRPRRSSLRPAGKGMVPVTATCHGDASIGRRSNAAGLFLDMGGSSEAQRLVVSLVVGLVAASWLPTGGRPGPWAFESQLVSFEILMVGIPHSDPCCWTFMQSFVLFGII
jgi:hypothetical protein